MHHAVQGAAGVRRFDIEAGPLDAVLGKVVQQRNAVDSKSVCCDKASSSIRAVVSPLIAGHGITELAAVEVDADLLIRLRPISDFRDGLGNGSRKTGEVRRLIICGRGSGRGIGHQGGGRRGDHADPGGVQR